MSEMTPEEAAEYIVQAGLKAEAEWVFRPGCPCSRCHDHEIRAAVEAERERIHGELHRICRLIDPADESVQIEWILARFLELDDAIHARGESDAG